MAFENVTSLEAEVTISLGGVNRKTNKANPVTAEGYFLGSKKVDDQKKKCGYSYIHILQTESGNLGVWGKTNLDKKILNVAPGTMVRLTQSGMQKTPNGEMYLYRVEQDKLNVIDAVNLTDGTAEANTAYEDADGETGLTEDEAPLDEVRPARTLATRPSAPAATAPTPAKQSAIQALLNKNRARTA